MQKWEMLQNAMTWPFSPANEVKFDGSNLAIHDCNASDLATSPDQNDDLEKRFGDVAFGVPRQFHSFHMLSLLDKTSVAEVSR